MGASWRGPTLVVREAEPRDVVGACPGEVRGVRGADPDRGRGCGACWRPMRLSGRPLKRNPFAREEGGPCADDRDAKSSRRQISCA